MYEAILSRKKDQDTKALKNGSCYKQGKISYKAVSSSKFDTDELQISFQILDLILRNFVLFF